MRKIRWFRLLLFSFAAYLGFCAVIASFKEDLIFPVRGVARAQALRPPADAAVWWLENTPGVRTEAWFFLGNGRSSTAPGPAVVCFHGNGELIDDNVSTARLFAAWGMSVLLIEYRGYGRSGGEPDIAEIRSDAVVWFDRVATRPEVRRDQVVAYGFSLGASFAAQLAEARPMAALIMESPFSSLPAMARRQRVYVYLARERLDSGGVLRTLPDTLPVLITHQKNDTIIPVADGRKLAALRPGAVYAEGEGGHYPLALNDPAHALLRSFLKPFINVAAPTAAEANALTQRLH